MTQSVYLSGGPLGGTVVEVESSEALARFHTLPPADEQMSRIDCVYAPIYQSTLNDQRVQTSRLAGGGTVERLPVLVWVPQGE